MMVFQDQNVHLQLAIGVFELPNAVERISKKEKKKRKEQLFPPLFEFVNETLAVFCH